MKNILLVDDSVTLRRQVVKALQPLGWNIIEAEDGLDGIEQLKKNKDIQLIICDVNMPNLNGIGMCEKIHKDLNLNNIPIFMLTTEADITMKTKARECGVKAWIVKPFIEENFIKSIQKILGE